MYILLNIALYVYRDQTFILRKMFRQISVAELAIGLDHEESWRVSHRLQPSTRQAQQDKKSFLYFYDELSACRSISSCMSTVRWEKYGYIEEKRQKRTETWL